MDSSFTPQVAQLSPEVRLPFVERGDPSGIPVILLHGFLDSWRSFELVLPRLPDSIHAYAVTQRGHGEASRPDAGYSLVDFAADLRDLMDILDIERAVLVGHSMGSAVVRRFAVDHPERALGLVLIGASATTRGTPEARAYWDAVMADLTDPVDEEFVRAAFEQDFAGPIRAEFLDALVKEGVKVPAFVWRAAIEARWKATENLDELRSIAIPTLICWGDRDPRYPRSDQVELVRLIPGSRLVVYRGAGHGPHWEQPERFASDLADFVAELS
jgi:pimeloyl-ACP methyl ester carboxylesterase